MIRHEPLTDSTFCFWQSSDLMNQLLSISQLVQFVSIKTGYLYGFFLTWSSYIKIKAGIK